MYTITETYMFKTDLKSKVTLGKFASTLGYFLFGILSKDNQTLMTNGAGADIVLYDLNKGFDSVPEHFDIIRYSGWVYFDLSPDCRTLI